MNIVRKPIITRTPIKTGEIYKTIASVSVDYSNPVVMGVYPDLYTARQNYMGDIDNYKNNGGGGTHFAITRTTQKEDE